MVELSRSSTPGSSFLLVNWRLSYFGHQRRQFEKCPLDITQTCIAQYTPVGYLLTVKEILKFRLSFGRTIKKHNTVKFLVRIAPSGIITFLSKAWGDGASIWPTHHSRIWVPWSPRTSSLSNGRQGLYDKRRSHSERVYIGNPATKFRASKDKVIVTKKNCQCPDTSGKSYWPNASFFNFEQSSTNYTCPSYRWHSCSLRRSF